MLAFTSSQISLSSVHNCFSYFANRRANEGRWNEYHARRKWREIINTKASFCLKVHSHSMRRGIVQHVASFFNAPHPVWTDLYSLNRSRRSLVYRHTSITECSCFLTAMMFGNLLLRPPCGESTTQRSDQQASSASRPREEGRKRANFVWHFIVNDYDD